mgnify:CR=1 FL=1
MDAVKVGGKQSRDDFLAEAARAFDTMFDPGKQDQLITLTQREQLAVALGKLLSARMLGQHVTQDAAATPSRTGAAACCPKCKQPGAAIKSTDPPQRQVTTLAGELEMSREQYRCEKCRIVFFPLGPQIGLEHGRLQSAGAEKDRSAGRKSAVLCGRQRRSQGTGRVDRQPQARPAAD